MTYFNSSFAADALDEEESEAKNWSTLPLGHDAEIVGGGVDKKPGIK